VFHELSENGLANIHSSLSRACHPGPNRAESATRPSENIQIEKSGIAPNKMIPRGLFAIEKV